MANPIPIPIPINDRRLTDSSNSPELFRLLVESIRDYAIFILDPEGRVLTWNPGAQAMKGYTRQEIVGKHFSKFYLPEAIQSAGQNMNYKLRRKKAGSRMRAGACGKMGHPFGRL